MATFSVSASQENIEFSKKMVAAYMQEGDNQEDGLRRIMDLAEREQTRETHPELSKSLKSIDGTISTLIAQINGIVAGQDGQIRQLQDRVNTAIAEKNAAQEEAKKQMEEAEKKQESAEAATKSAAEEIEKAKAAAQECIDRANAERDQAIMERDAAQTVAAEKTASNDLLMRQAAAAEADLETYKQLQADYAAQHDIVVQLQKQAAVDAAKAEAQQQRIDALQAAAKAAGTEHQTQIDALKNNVQSLTEANKTMAGEIAELKKQAAVDTAEYDTRLVQEKIKMQAEMFEKLQVLDHENAKLEAQVAELTKQLEAQKNK